MNAAETAAPKYVGTTQTVKLRERSGRVVIHNIEVIGYHVRGWKRTRCLSHGIDAVTTDAGDDAATAVHAARECRRLRLLPFAPHAKEIQPVLGA